MLHQRRILSVLTANNRLNWKRFAQGFSLYLLFLLIAATVTENIFADTEFRFGIRLPEVSARGAVMLFGSIMISAAVEEVFYRGYILQALASPDQKSAPTGSGMRRFVHVCAQRARSTECHVVSPGLF